MKALTIFCAALLLCVAAFAYPGDVVNVSFAHPVMVGDTTLPAGNVQITIQRSNSYVLLTFRSDEGVVASMPAKLISDPTEQHSEATVILDRVNGALKVHRLWLPDSTGFELLPLK